MKTKWLVAITLALLVAGGFFWLRGKMLSYVVIKNQSGQEIATLEILVSSRRLAFSAVPPGEFRWGRFTVTHDDHFEVSGKLADGTGIAGSHGYVSSGMTGVRASFEIEKGGLITFSQN